MKWYKAQDTFIAGLEDGGERLVTKGEALPENHELVRRDLEARKRDGGTPLFAALDPGEPEPEPRKRPVARAAAKKAD